MKLKDTGLTAQDIKDKVKKYMIETYERFDFIAETAEGVGGEFCRLQERGNPGSGKKFFKDYIEGRFQSFGRSGGDWLRYTA